MTSWPRHYVLQSDYTRVFTTCEHDVKTKDFDHVVYLNRKDIPWTWTEWCRTNCSDVWAWWFDADGCYVGFDSASDAMWFALKFKDSGDNYEPE